MKNIYIFFAAFLSSFFTMNAQSYCTPAFPLGCSSGDNIDSFSIPSAAFSHTDTGCSNGAYGDFSSEFIVLQAGTAYPFTVSHGFGNQNVKIWVDLNNDGTFTNAAPELLSTTVSSGSTTNGNLTIPAGTPDGNYRLRIATRWGTGSLPTPCNTTGFGEAHDYTVIIGPPPTCLQPTAPTHNNITSNSVQLGWAVPTVVPSNGYQYYVSTTNTAPTATTTPSGTSPSNSVTAGGLNPNTVYYWWVRSDCGAGDYSFWALGGSFTTGQIAATIPYSQNFNGDNDFGFANGSQTNKWHYGSAAGNPSNAIYISNNNGVANAYSSNSSSVVHAYRDIIIPAGTSIATFSFDWKSQGENNYDYLRVWLVPISFMPVSGTQTDAATSGGVQIPGNFQMQNTWQTYTNPTLDISSFAGSTMRLIFEWRNDGSGGAQPPVAVDNVSLTIPACSPPSPSGLTVSNLTPTSATINWLATTPAPANGYEYYYSTSNTPPTAATAGTATNSLTTNLDPLVSGTTYYWWVRAICSTSESSSWVPGPAFTPGQIGGGNLTTGQLPVYSCYGYNYSQQIYTASEVTTALGNHHYITKIKFFVADPASDQSKYNEWTVFMGNTNKNSFSSDTDWVPLTSLTQVFSGSLGVMTEGNWVEINLATPFIWDGVSNLVIAVDENVSGYSCTADWGAYEAGSERGILYRNDSTNPDPANPPTASDRYSNLPRLQMEGMPLPECTTAPPTSLNTMNITDTSAQLTWMPAQNATYILEWRQLPTGNWTSVPGLNFASHNLTGLTEQTTYEWRVRYICENGVESDFGGPEQFTTKPLQWCPANSTATPVDEHITNVTVTPSLNSYPQQNPMSNASGASTYTDYYLDESKQITLVKNSQGNTISIAKGWAAEPSSVAVSVWIDWNRDGDFSDPGEQVMTSPANQTTPVTGTINVPPVTNSSNYPTKMRVIARKTTAPDACGTFADGEVEDYAVKLIDEILCNNSAPAVTSSGITHNSVTLNWTADPGGASYIVRYKKIGAAAWEAQIPLASLSTTYTINALNAATQYIIEVVALCNNVAGTPSVTQITTNCDPAPPANLQVNQISATSAVVTWDAVPTAVYVLQYRKVGVTNWTTVNAPTNTYTLLNLDPYSNYEVKVASECSGTLNPYTTPKVFTTLPTCQMAPVGLTVINITMTQAQVEWDALPGATYVLRWRKVGGSGWNTVNVSENSYVITGLTEETQYEVQIANVCNGTQQIFTHPYVFNTPGLTYCNMQGTSAAAEHISNVTVKPEGGATMSNDSGASSYTSYLTDAEKTIILKQGSIGNQVSVSKAWVGPQKNEAVTVWLDFNRNGIFENNERILIAPANTASPVTATFNVPANAYASLTNDKYVVMRVAMSRGQSPEMCSSFANGEVEDYKVRIVKQMPSNILDNDQIIIYPNPTKNILNITKVEDGSTYKIYDAAGRVVQGGSIFGNKINVDALINGIFTIDIEAKNGERVQKKFIKE